MKIHFLIQVELDERTRLLREEELLAEPLQKVAETFFMIWTSGPQPAVKAIQVSPGVSDVLAVMK